MFQCLYIQEQGSDEIFGISCFSREWYLKSFANPKISGTAENLGNTQNSGTHFKAYIY